MHATSRKHLVIYFDVCLLYYIKDQKFDVGNTGKINIVLRLMLNVCMFV